MDFKYELTKYKSYPLFLSLEAKAPLWKLES